MSAISSHPPTLTVSEYLEREFRAEVRSEFLAGRIRMMAGGTYRHSTVCLSMGALVWAALRGKICRASESNTRVAISRRGAFVYPDLTVVCGEPVFDPIDKRRLTILNPTLVVEVLSEGTENYDRGEKFSLYRSIESLREYVIVETESPRIETFFRHEDGNWQFSAFESLTEVLRLRSIGVELPMAGIYERVDFPAPESSDPPAAR